MQEFTMIIGAIGTIAAFVFAFISWNRGSKHDSNKEAKQDATILVELGYIKSLIEEVKNRQEKQDERYMELCERVASIEASTKQAHRRIDDITGRKDDN